MGATVQNIKILVHHGRKPEGTALGLLFMALLAHKGFKRALYAALVGQAAISVKTKIETSYRFTNPTADSYNPLGNSPSRSDPFCLL